MLTFTIVESLLASAILDNEEKSHKMNIRTELNFANISQKLTDANIGILITQFHKLANLSDKLVALSDHLTDDVDEEIIERMRSTIRWQIHEISRSMAQKKGSSVNEECGRINVILRYFANEGIDPCEAPGLVDALDRYAISFFQGDNKDGK